MSHRTSRRQALAPVGLLLATALGASVLTGVGAATAAPAEDCAVPFPVADVAAGDDVHGLTVTRGTVPQPFSGDVVGTVHDGIAPGVDMVMVKVDPSTLDIDPTEVKGIWQGMSGSPVYAADGRLIGAVAYGLSLEQSWVAGVTPYEQMDDYLGGTVGRVALDRATAARVAGVAGVSVAQASRGFTQLPVPLGVAGVPARFLSPSAAAVAKHSWLRGDTYALGRARVASAPGVDSIVAGGNLAASESYGEIVMAGVGTATSVCRGEVVGFGHPMSFTGSSTMSLHPAEAVYVQGSAPAFKVANVGAPVGTIFGDHLTGITGRLGAVPSTTTVTSTVSAGTRTRTGTSYVSVRRSDNLALMTYLQSAVNHSLVLDGSTPGSEVVTLTLRGSDAKARPFTLSWTDRYLATWDLAEEVGLNVGSLTASLAASPKATVDSIVAVGRATADATQFRVARIEQRRAGAWVRVTERKPALARAGGVLRIRAVLRSGAKVVRMPFRFDVPRKASGKTAVLDVTGGLSTTADFGASIAAARRALSTAVRSDTVRVQFGRVIPSVGGDYPDDEGFPDDFQDFSRRDPSAAPGPVKFLKTKTSTPVAAVVGESQSAMVLIR